MEAHFGQFGEMTKCKMNYRNGQPSGTAFIEYSSPEDAAKAIAESNGFTLDDRKIWCEFSGQQRSQGNAP